MKYKTLFIDLDDTLLDFKAASRNSLSNLLEGMGIPPSHSLINEFEAINSKCWRMLEEGEITREELSKRRFEIFFHALGIKRDPLEANALFRAGLAESAVLKEGALELCRDLCATNTLCLVTNGFSDTQRSRLKACGLEPFFKYLFISSEVGHEKPDRRFFLSALKACNGDARSCLILGDSLSSDIKGGLESGIDTCWYNPLGLDGTGYTYMIKELSEFTNIVLSH